MTDAPTFTEFVPLDYANAQFEAGVRAGLKAAAKAVRRVEEDWIDESSGDYLTHSCAEIKTCAIQKIRAINPAQIARDAKG